MSEFPIKVEAVKPSSFPAIWTGIAQLPKRRFASPVMIFLRDDQYVLISALCPHQGYDMSTENLTAQGRLVCPLHGLEIDVFNNQNSFSVVKQADEFVITGFNL